MLLPGAPGLLSSGGTFVVSIDVLVVVWLYSEFFTGLRKQHIIYTMKTKFYIAIALSAALLAASCSSGSDSESGTSTSAPETIADTTAAVLSETATTTSAPSGNVEEETSLVVPFTAANGSGTVAVFGDGSPVVAWFGGLPGEVSLDLADADVSDAASVVEELVSFWFFQDDDSGDVPPNIYVSASGDISDSVGTRYVVEAQGLPPAPVAETTTTTSSTSTTSTSSVPGTSEPPSATTSSTTTTTSSTTTTTTVVESPVVLQVQVLNGSGVAGAAGRMTDKLSEAGYVVLSPENAPQRYSSSAVYYQEGWKDRAEEILQAADIEEIDAPTAMPQQFASEDAAVIVLLGTDTAPAVAREQAGLRPRQRNDVRLPLADSVPRDRYVPGLSDIQIFSRINDEGSDSMKAKLDELKLFVRYAGQYSPDGTFGIFPNERDTAGTLQQTWQLIEDTLLWMGFTPQNVCGAPAGYSFTDLLQPTREWNASTRTYSGDAIFTTDRLIELHGGERINPESNLEFYIREAVQTAHDALRLPELSAETEAMQLILCRALLAPSGEVPELANSLWYANLTPGIQPRESLLSQGTYHVKEISRNGNWVGLYVCHPTEGARGIILYWRETGYRAEVTGSTNYNGCQTAFEEYDYWGDIGSEDTIKFSFGERVFFASDLLEFPRG